MPMTFDEIPDQGSGRPPAAPADFDALPDQSSSPGMLSAIWEGIKHGVTAGWSPQITGALSAAGLQQEMPYLTDAQIADIQSHGGIPGAYAAARDAAERDVKAATTAHPGAFRAGDLGGTVAAMLLAPEARTATLGARVVQGARIAGVYGGLEGAAEGNREGGVVPAVTRSVEGAVTGALGGAGGAVLGAGLERGAKIIYDTFGRPIVSTVRGWINPDAEAARRVVGALAADAPQVAAGQTPGLTPAQWVAAHGAGEPVMTADLGGETTRALLRSAANTSPEGRALITGATQQRYLDQGDRIAQTVRGLTGGANATAMRDQLQAAYDAVRSRLYGTAYQDGDRPLVSPTLERMLGSPAVVSAMRDAVAQGQDRAIVQGLGAFRPGVQITDDGRVLFARGAAGVPAYPNLQFWDYTYRALRDQGNAAIRAGRNSEGSALTSLAGSMRDELDNLVPSYAQARGVAASFFGANDALEAGAKAVNFRGDPVLVAKTVAKMTPAERSLFQEGYASALAEKIEALPDRNDALRFVYQSPQERRKMTAVFGAQIAGVMEPLINRETVFNAARTALGNSTTARQLIEAGLAGGAAGAYLGSGDPKQILAYGLGGVGLRRLAPDAALAGVRTLVGYVDRNTAARVAKLLTSGDFNDVMRALRMARNNPRIGDGLRALAHRLSIASTATPLRGAPPQLQLPAPAGAEPQQNDIPRPPSQ